MLRKEINVNVLRKERPASNSLSLSKDEHFK
jgi:hypothetical protein